MCSDATLRIDDPNMNLTARDENLALERVELDARPVYASKWYFVSQDYTVVFLVVELLLIIVRLLALHQHRLVAHVG